IVAADIARLEKWRSLRDGDKATDDTDIGYRRRDRANHFVIAEINRADAPDVGSGLNGMRALGPSERVCPLVNIQRWELMARALGVHVHDVVEQAAIRDRAAKIDCGVQTDIRLWRYDREVEAIVQPTEARHIGQVRREHAGQLRHGIARALRTDAGGDLLRDV